MMIINGGSDISNFGSNSASTTAKNIGVSAQIRRAEEERQKREKEKGKGKKESGLGGLYGRYGNGKKYGEGKKYGW